MNGARLWPIAIVAVLGITVVANIGLYMAANDRDAPAPEPDYYRKAVAWDTTLAEERTSAALGWNLSAALAPGPGGEGVLALRLADRSGGSIAGALATVTAVHDFAPMRTVDGAVALDADGAASLHLPLARTGLWELRVRIRRGTDTFVCTLHRELARATP